MEFNPEETLKQKNIRLYMGLSIFKHKLLKNIPGKCMEINCAFGHTTRDILLPTLHAASTIIGTDNSKSMIQYAKRNYNHERIEFDIFDIQTENLPEKYIGEFDHIFSFPTIHSHSNLLQEFRNVYNMLKPGGSFYVSVVTSHDAFELYARMLDNPIFGDYFTKYVSPLSVFLINPKEVVKELLTDIGFKVEYCESSTFIYKSQYLLPYIIYGLEFIKELPRAGQQRVVKKQLAEEFARMEKKISQNTSNNNTQNENPDFTDMYDVLEIYASKP